MMVKVDYEMFCKDMETYMDTAVKDSEVVMIHLDNQNNVVMISEEVYRNFLQCLDS